MVYNVLEQLPECLTPHISLRVVVFDDLVKSIRSEGVENRSHHYLMLIPAFRRALICPKVLLSSIAVGDSPCHLEHQIHSAE